MKLGFIRVEEWPKCAPDARRADNVACDGGLCSPSLGLKEFSGLMFDPYSENVLTCAFVISKIPVFERNLRWRTQ